MQYPKLEVSQRFEVSSFFTENDLSDMSMLIGANHYWDIVMDEIVRGSELMYRLLTLRNAHKTF